MMRKRILIVEDDRAIAEMLQLMLQGEGYHVEMQTDAQMVQKMQGPLPDLLLLDIRLSGADGRAICRHLKSQERTRHLPIILISATRQTEDIARETGAEAFLAKPFAMEEFLALVAQYVGTHPKDIEKQDCQTDTSNDDLFVILFNHKGNYRHGFA